MHSIKKHKCGHIKYRPVITQTIPHKTYTCLAEPYSSCKQSLDFLDRRPFLISSKRGPVLLGKDTRRYLEESAPGIEP